MFILPESQLFLFTNFSWMCPFVILHKIQDYFIIREIKVWLNINHSNTFYILKIQKLHNKQTSNLHTHTHTHTHCSDI